VLALRSGGLPSTRERGRLAGVLSPGFVRLLETASEVQALCMRTAPKDEKPLMIEGALFVGNNEGATEVAYGDVRRDGDLVVVEAHLVYVDPRFPKAHRHRAVAWTDRVELRAVDGQWRVHDVRIAGDRSLVGELQAFIDEGRRTCRTR
jgi:hypothetical protein